MIINARNTFPKEYQNETTFDGNEFPKYRRRNTGLSYDKSPTFKVDNRLIVPYNSELLQIFDCHINVEAVSSLKSVKYIYKYIYKGHDSAYLIITGPSNETTINHDEIRNFIEARYVGPSETCWRILNKPLQDKSHSIIRLPIHLPNEQNITINLDNQNQDLESALNKVTIPKFSDRKLLDGN